MNGKPWYHDGLRFQCTQCGKCCVGGPGYVWVSREEIEAMAAAMGLEADEFQEMYVRKIGLRHSLREYPNGDCVFFDTGTRTCCVYQARPRQCRTWPFWDSNLRTPDDWNRTCSACPGSGSGRIYSLNQIEADRQAMRL